MSELEEREKIGEGRAGAPVYMQEMMGEAGRGKVTHYTSPTQGSTPALQRTSRARFSWERGSEVGAFAPSCGGSAAFNGLSRCSLQPLAMWWALLSEPENKAVLERGR